MRMCDNAPALNPASRLPFDPPDYSLIEGTEAAYRGFFPRPEPQATPPGARDVLVPVAEGVEIGCRLHPGAPEGPSILFFHGNGETVPDYDGIAPAYTRLGINLFVADYRGYGFSTGLPSFPTMLQDAHKVLAAFQQTLDGEGRTGPRFVMGRSMGCHSAVELAAHHPDELRGLIAESGAASASRMVEYLEAAGRAEEAAELGRRHLDKIRAIALPILMIHGEWDELIPLARALEFYEMLTVEQKRLLVIRQAGHNDIMWVGMREYMEAVREFVYRVEEEQEAGKGSG